MYQTKQDARRNGYVSTMLGHRRYLPDITIADSGRRAAAERQAINSVVQGSASDVIKLAMIRMEHHIAKVSPEDRKTRLGHLHCTIPPLLCYSYTSETRIHISSFAISHAVLPFPSPLPSPPC